MEYYTVGKLASAIGKSITTLRNWDNKDVLKPHHVTKGGTRFYSQDQLNYLLSLKADNKLNIKTLSEGKFKAEKIYETNDVAYISIRINKDIQSQLKRGLAKKNMTLQDYIAGLLIKDGMVKINEGKYI